MDSDKNGPRAPDDGFKLLGPANSPRIVNGIDTVTGENVAGANDENRKLAPWLQEPRERIVRSASDPKHPQYIYYRKAELENRVKQDDISPLYTPMEVEERVRKECGLECCIAGPHDELAIAAALWPWEIACCYIAAQTIKGAEDNSAAFWKWRGRLARDGVRPGQIMSFADADRLLRRAVLKGRIRVRRDSDLDAEDIPTSEWPRLTWETANNGEVHEFLRLLRDGVPCYENPVLVADEVKAWLQALAAPVPAKAVVSLETLGPQDCKPTAPPTETEPVGEGIEFDAVELPQHGPQPLGYLYIGEFRRRLRINKSKGLESEAVYLRNWLRTEINCGRIQLPEGRAIPSLSRIEDVIRAERRLLMEAKKAAS